MDQFACPRCLKMLVWEAARAGQTHVCPSCNAEIQVPASPGVPRAILLPGQTNTPALPPHSYPMVGDPYPPIAVGTDRMTKRQAWQRVRFGLGWCFWGLLVGWGMFLLAASMSHQHLAHGPGMHSEATCPLFVAPIFLGCGLFVNISAPEGWIRFVGQVVFASFVMLTIGPACCCDAFHHFGRPLGVGMVGTYTGIALWLVAFDFFLWAIVIHFKDAQLWLQPRLLTFYHGFIVALMVCVGVTIERVDSSVVTLFLILQTIAVFWQMRLISQIRDVIARHTARL